MTNSNVNSVGRPRIVVTPSILVKSYNRYRDWDKVAESLNISRATLYRRLDEFGMKKSYSWR